MWLTNLLKRQTAFGKSQSNTSPQMDLFGQAPSWYTHLTYQRLKNLLQTRHKQHMALTHAGRKSNPTNNN